MATRAAIAAADRKSKEEIAAKERYQKDRHFKEENRREWFKANSQHLKNSAGATKDLVGAAGGLGKLMNNDPEWYKRYGYNPFAAALPDFYRLGTRQFPSWRDKSDTQEPVPGIMVFTFQDTLPNQNETNVVNSTYYKGSPINVSLTRFMANLRKLNSRIGDYDPADLGLYWYAIRSHIEVIGMVVKALQIYNTYFATNAYFARSLILASGFDPDDFCEHIAEYKLLIQKHINLFNASAVVPTNLSFILRGIWLSTCLVKDHESDASQIYMFRPYSFGHLSSDESTVVYSKVSYPISYNTVRNRLETNSDNLFNSVGIVTMTADLRSAYGNSVMQFNPDINGVVAFSSSKHDLEQIHNLRTLPGYQKADGSIGVSDLSALNIFQDTDGYLKQGNGTSCIYVTWDAVFEDMAMDDLSVSAARDYEYLDFYDEESCTPDMYLEATRLRTVIFSSQATGLNGRLIKYNGTEVVTYGEMYWLRPDRLDVYTAYFTTDIGILNATLILIDAWFKLLHQYSTFDWLPIQRYFLQLEDYDGGPEYWHDIGELDHVVTLPQQNLKWLHEVATLSEFYTDPIAPGRK
jgi:hypothetical protein